MIVCKFCGGDVRKTYVGPAPKWIHAVEGIAHSPLPIEAPTATRTHQPGEVGGSLRSLEGSQRVSSRARLL